MSNEADAAGARIEALLDDLRSTAGPLAWQKVEALMRALMDLYARGLGRLFEHLDAAGALDEPLRTTLAGDELVASLLALHGLHPLPVEDRIARALDRVSPQLGSVVLVSVEGDVARLRVVDAPSVRGAAGLLERVVVEVAPEIARVEIEGLREPAKPSSLVQIDLAMSRARAKP